LKEESPPVDTSARYKAFSELEAPELPTFFEGELLFGRFSNSCKLS